MGLLSRILLAGVIILASGDWTSSSFAAEGKSNSGDWSKERFATERFVAGELPSVEGTGFYVGVEIAMRPGWKTYWRNPGDAGGVPPEFVWEGSTNLKEATVRFPAPQRLVDKSGHSIGYKEYVIFPVLIEPEDPAQPVKLNLELNYGLCQDICIPVSASLNREFMPGASSELGGDGLSVALGSVPRADNELSTKDPKLVRSSFELSGVSPKLKIDARFASADSLADAFVEAPAGYYIPMLQKVSEDDTGAVVFEADLSDGVDVEELKGQTLRVTLVGSDGASETDIVVH